MRGSRALRSIMTGLTLLALMAGGFVVCPCEASSEDAHACCVSTVWRESSGGCCGAADDVPDTATAPSDDVFVPAPASLTAPARVAASLSRPTRSTTSSVSPPATVLRI